LTRFRRRFVYALADFGKRPAVLDALVRLSGDVRKKDTPETKSRSQGPRPDSAEFFAELVDATAVWVQAYAWKKDPVRLRGPRRFSLRRFSQRLEKLAWDIERLNSTFYASPVRALRATSASLRKRPSRQNAPRPWFPFTQMSQNLDEEASSYADLPQLLHKYLLRLRQLKNPQRRRLAPADGEANEESVEFDPSHPNRDPVRDAEKRLLELVYARTGHRHYRELVALQRAIQFFATGRELVTKTDRLMKSMETFDSRYRKTGKRPVLLDDLEVMAALKEASLSKETRR
jgi:hypothetical protein